MRFYILTSTASIFFDFIFFFNPKPGRSQWPRVNASLIQAATMYEIIFNSICNLFFFISLFLAPIPTDLSRQNGFSALSYFLLFKASSERAFRSIWSERLLSAHFQLKHYRAHKKTWRYTFLFCCLFGQTIQLADECVAGALCWLISYDVPGHFSFFSLIAGSDNASNAWLFILVRS